MTGPWYCGERVLKGAMGVDASATDMDVQIGLTLETVSRQIEQETGHNSFQPQKLTQLYTARDARTVYVDDLLSVTSLKTDTSGKRNFDTLLSATCYELEPYNAPNDSPPHPYWEIYVLPNSTQVFPSWRNGIQVTGSFAFYDVQRRATKLSTSNLDGTATSFGAASASAVTAGNTLNLDGEQMFVNSVATTSGPGTVNVDRAVNGTSGTTHSASADINVYQYPIVERACMIQASRILGRRHSPMGVIGSADVGQIRLTAALDPDVKRLLDPLTERVMS